MAKPGGQSWTVHNLGRLIKFGVKYMESGFLDVLNTAIGNADTYKPAIIRFNPFVTAKSSVLPNASSSRTVADGDESLAVGCSTKLDHVDVSSESTSYHFDSDPAAFCDPEQIRQKKLCQLRVPPSVYTGKMRLMVQAIYGSKRNDYTYASESAGMDNLVLAGVSLGISTPTAGLYTAPDGSYWLIKIGSNVTYQKLKISGAYQAAIAGEPLSEAYALSRLVPVGDIITMSGSSLTTALNGMSPLAYGWKFNSAGDKASIVVYKTKTGLAAKNWPAGTSTTATGIESALLTVQIGWDTTNLLPTFTSVTTVSTGYHLPFTQCKIFSPIMVLSAQMMQCLMVDYASLGKIGNYSCPVYCYYDNNDELQVITAKNGDYSVRSSTDNRPPNKVNGETRISWVVSPHTGNLVPATTAWAAAGFTVGSDDYTYERTTTSGGSLTEEKWVQWQPEADGTPTENGLPFDSASGNAYRYDWYTNLNSKTIQSSLAYGNYQSAQTLLIVPWYDAESAIIGVDRSRGATSWNALAYKGGNDFRYQRDLWSFATISGHKQWVAYVSSAFPTWTGSDVTNGGPQITLTDAEKEAALASSSVSRYHTQIAKLYAATSLVAEIYNAGGTLSTTAADYDLDLTELFEVTAIDPYLEYPIEVKSSYSGAIKWAVVGSIGGQQDWPDFTNLSPVGWA